MQTKIRARIFKLCDGWHVVYSGCSFPGTRTGFDSWQDALDAACEVIRYGGIKLTFRREA